MAVASRTASRESHPDGRNRFYSITRVENRVFLVDDSAFVGRHVAAIETGRDFLIERGIGKKIARQIFNRELIIRHVLAEGLDDPVTVSPHLTIVIEVNAVRVGVARIVQPITPTMLAPLRRLQKLIDKFFVSVLGRITDKRVHTFRGWRQTGDVKTGSTRQRAPIGRSRRSES